MLSLLNLIRFREGLVTRRRCHSKLVDLYQIHVRNVFLFCFGLSIARQVFGDNISCHSQRASLSERYIELQCFINGTFSELDEGNLQHDYYQWISVLLLLLAFNFYFPFRVWSRMCGSYLDEVCGKTEDEKTCYRVLDTIRDSRGNALFWKTWALECYYALHLALTLIALDHFFNGAWSTYGLRLSTIRLVFPETGKCFIDYFSGGATTEGKFTCLLPLNSVYRKVFAALMGMVLGLIALHAVSFVYRVAQIFRFGTRYIDEWWSISIAKESASSWRIKKTFEREQCREKGRDLERLGRIRLETF